jgi:hypothetical protein
VQPESQPQKNLERHLPSLHKRIIPLAHLGIARAHALTHFPGKQFLQEFRWSPDGKNLAVLRGHTNSNIVLLRESHP